MRMSAGEIARLLGGRAVGEAGKTVTGIAPLQDAGPDDLSFLSDSKYLKFLAASKAGVLLLKQGTELPGRTAVWVEDPQLAILKILTLVAQEKEKAASGTHPSAVVASSARIGAAASIGAHCVVEEGAQIGEGTRLDALSYVGRNARLGKNCRIYPHVTLREEVVLGDRVIVHSGTVIGSDGFGYATRGQTHHKIPQVGTVVVEDDVEIGANVTVDRATIGRTLIGAGSKIDNLVQIAHNVQIGRGCILVAQAGVAGSSRLGNFVTLAGQVGVVGHISIGDGAIAAAQSGIPNDLPAGAVVFGSPARPIQEERKIQAILGKLPEIYRDFRKIKKKLDIGEQD